MHFAWNETAKLGGIEEIINELYFHISIIWKTLEILKNYKGRNLTVEDGPFNGNGAMQLEDPEG